MLAMADTTTRARLVSLSDDRLGLWTADDVDADGRAVTLRAEGADSPAVTGTAQVVRSGRAFDETCAKLRRKYGRRVRPSHIEAVVLVTLE